MSDIRIQVNEIDKSQSVQSGITEIGATVARLARGPEEPIYFSKGNEALIVNVLGYPNSNNPDVQEILDFNKESGIWVSAPTKNGKYGGVVVTTGGIVPFTEGLSTLDNFTVSDLSYKETVDTADGIETTFALTLDKDYKDNTIEIRINGIAIADLASSEAATEIITGTGLTTGSQLVRATGVLTLVFLAAPADGTLIEAVYKTDLSSITYFTLITSNPRAENDKVLVTYDTILGFFNIKYYQKNYRNQFALVKEYTVSQISGTTDGFGDNIFVETILEDDYYLRGFGNNNKAYSAYTNPTIASTITAGTRGETLTITELTAGWAYFQRFREYTADIFMDFTAIAGVEAIFDTLRTTYQKYKSYILPFLRTSDKDAVQTLKNSYSINNRGLAFYFNHALTRDNYVADKFYISQIGRIGVKYAQMYDVYNGLSVSMIDENNHGGQLTGTTLKTFFDPSEDTIAELANAGINAIVLDPLYGAMIKHEKTAQTTAVYSDTSFVSNSRMFDYIILNVINQVLIFQIDKLNDTTHRTLVKTKIESIVNPLVSLNLLREFAVKCDEENNNDEILAKKQFKVALAVKITPKSRTIVFDFIASAQGVDVEENFI